MDEYIICLKINKEDGFIPVSRTAKIIEKIGGIHKYSALLEVKDGEREYTINVLLDNDKKRELEEWLSCCPDILQYKFNMLY